MCSMHTKSKWEAGVDTQKGMYFGLSGGSGGCGGVFQKTFLVRDEGGVFRGGWWCFGLVGGIFN